MLSTSPLSRNRAPHAAVIRRRCRFAFYLFLAVVFASGVGCGKNRRNDYLCAEYERLQAAAPMESIEQRLPRMVVPSAGGDLQRLERLETTIAKEVPNYRLAALKHIHDKTVDEFVKSPGFGYGRMGEMPTVELLMLDPRDPALEIFDYFHPEAIDTPPIENRSLPASSILGRLHEDGILDFVNPRGFGYFKDRQHVAGFQSHGFSKIPGPVEEWKVANLELVGLVKNETPAVYLSRKLPRMDELKDAKTRPLDAFEFEPLAALRGGEDLHIGSGPDAARFVGAIRSTKQCVECHGGTRGDLLGAFTYRLRPVR